MRCGANAAATEQAYRGRSGAQPASRRRARPILRFTRLHSLPSLLLTDAAALIRRGGRYAQSADCYLQLLSSLDADPILSHCLRAAATPAQKRLIQIFLPDLMSKAVLPIPCMARPHRRLHVAIAAPAITSSRLMMARTRRMGRRLLARYCRKGMEAVEDTMAALRMMDTVQMWVVSLWRLRPTRSSIHRGATISGCLEGMMTRRSSTCGAGCLARPDATIYRALRRRFKNWRRRRLTVSECSERLSEACVCDCEVLIVMCAKKFPLYLSLYRTHSCTRHCIVLCYVDCALTPRRDRSAWQGPTCAGRRGDAGRSCRGPCSP